MGALSFAFPAALAGLILLPVIWWLLRLVPPKPETEIFPPLRILARIAKKDETPAKSPWWLTLLRLTLAGLVVIALARPFLNPQSQLTSGDGPLLILMENDWASGPDWEDRVRTAEALISQAGQRGLPIAIDSTVSAAQAEVALIDQENAARQLGAIEPIAARGNRDAALQRLIAATGDITDAPTLAIIGPSFAQANDPDLAALIDGANIGEVRLFRSNRESTLAITSAENTSDGFQITVIAAAAENENRQIATFDERNLVLAQAPIDFEDGAREASVVFDIPFELRNDMATIRILGEPSAANVYLLDDSNRRRRVGLLTGLAGDEAQPLLSPLFYIERALSPFADLLRPRTGELSTDLPEIINQGPAMIIMADIGVLPNAVTQALDEWIEEGGTLVRFAGPRLAASSQDDVYLPVTLREGERELGGALSWTEPQTVAPFSANGPFADLTAPREVTVTRQILAQPDADLGEKTWASLQDGTPLITASSRGDGSIVLFHVTADANWSNLPITGSFVEMLRRLADLSRNVGPAATVENATLGETTLAPLRIVDADGELGLPPAFVQPLELANADNTPDYNHPAGTYGVPDAFVALNLFSPNETLEPFVIDPQTASVSSAQLVQEREADLAGWVFFAALFLLMLDALAVLWINGFLRRFKPATASAALIACAFALTALPTNSYAQDVRETDSAIIDSISTTRIAYVITGDGALDEITDAGISGLTRFLASRTAFEPGEPSGVDIERDELSFYPLIYFPVSADTDMPSDFAIARLDAYMQNGGTILFDTRDDLTGTFTSGTTPETQRLREILRGLNVPPLEPVPADHVLTKSFYILDSFPGRYGGSPLWIQASEQDGSNDRPVRRGDGVSPIMITGNDLAAAWALDESGRPLLPIASGDPLQRIYAFRTGVNIMMYMLTGNYKADQVHIPALLERLGQ